LAANTVTSGRGNRSEVALRYALERAQTAELDVDAFSRRWQKAVWEYEDVREKLSAIENSDEYRAMRWLGRQLGRQDSLRRRGLVACLGAARRVGRDARLCTKCLRAICSDQSDFVGTPAPDMVSSADSPSLADGVPNGGKGIRSAPMTPEDLVYRPERWHLPERTFGDRFLDLLVLSPVHRTGSTLLQRICNARKGTLIWGEHGGVLTQFASIFFNAALFSLSGETEREEYFDKGENPNLWTANMCPELECVQEATISSARTLLNTLYGRYRKNHDVLGFKEVQYGRAELELLRRCYPKAQILLLLRHPLNTWRSTPKDWYPSLENWVTKYNEGVLGYLDFAKRDANCHVLRYEALIRQERKVMAVLSDVARVSPELVGMVLAHKIGSNARSGFVSSSDRDIILATCREPMDRLGYRDPGNA
jgi:hypothetical protein